MKTYVTFGQIHVHRIGKKVFDCDCVAVIECNSALEGRELTHECFGSLFCFSYFEDEFNSDSMKYFSRGLIEVN